MFCVLLCQVDTQFSQLDTRVWMFADMPQFGLSSGNSHWGYGGAAAYPPYLAGGGLPSCGAPTHTAPQFGAPLAFAAPEQPSSAQDFTANTILPDTTASELDQHLSGLVGSPPSHHSASSLLVPRYPNNNADCSLAGPRSLSDSSQAESPVQDDLLTSNTHLPNSTNTPNFPSLMSNHQNSTNYSNNCNNSLYPVLPASLLYSQLYTAANQTHNFHHPLHSNSIHASQNHHSDLQSMMDQITSTTSNHRQQHMGLSQGGGTELVGGGSCAAAAARGVEERGGGLGGLGGLGSLGGPRGQQQNDSNAVVWRPY